MNDPIFTVFGKKISVEPDGTVYADIINHCADYKSFIEKGDKPTSGHECTHGINAAIRNQAGDKVNGFYCLDDKSIVIREPGFRKSEVIKFIPKEFQGSRYNLYVVGQKSWDDCPLYLFDEWSAYINGGTVAAEIGTPEAGSDWLLGPLEFCAYGLAVCMMADEKGMLTPDLASFARYQLKRAFKLYLNWDDILPFIGQDDLYNLYQSGPAGQTYRDFMLSKLDFIVPILYKDGVILPGKQRYCRLLGSQRVR